MKGWIERRWIRSVSRTQCSPSLIIVALVVVAAVLVVRYHEMIVRTVVITAASIAAIGFLVLMFVIARMITGWEHKATPAAPPAEPGTIVVPDDLTAEVDALVAGAEAHIRKESKK